MEGEGGMGEEAEGKGGAQAQTDKGVPGECTFRMGCIAAWRIAGIKARRNQGKWEGWDEWPQFTWEAVVEDDERPQRGRPPAPGAASSRRQQELAGVRGVRRAKGGGCSGGKHTRRRRVWRSR